MPSCKASSVKPVVVNSFIACCCWIVVFIQGRGFVWLMYGEGYPKRSSRIWYMRFLPFVGGRFLFFEGVTGRDSIRDLVIKQRFNGL